MGRTNQGLTGGGAAGAIEGGAGSVLSDPGPGVGAAAIGGGGGGGASCAVVCGVAGCPSLGGGADWACAFDATNATEIPNA